MVATKSLFLTFTDAYAEPTLSSTDLKVWEFLKIDKKVKIMNFLFLIKFLKVNIYICKENSVKMFQPPLSVQVYSQRKEFALKELHLE